MRVIQVGLALAAILIMTFVASSSRRSREVPSVAAAEFELARGPGIPPSPIEPQRGRQRHVFAR